MLDDILLRKEPQVLPLLSLYGDSGNGISQCESARKEAKTAYSAPSFTIAWPHCDRFTTRVPLFLSLSLLLAVTDLPRDRPVGPVVASP